MNLSRITPRIAFDLDAVMAIWNDVDIAGKEVVRFALRTPSPKTFIVTVDLKAMYPWAQTSFGPGEPVPVATRLPSPSLADMSNWQGEG